MIQKLNYNISQSEKYGWGPDWFDCETFGEDLIYSIRSTEGLIESTIMKQIQMFCPGVNRYSVRAKVSFFKGDTRDIAVLNIIIDNRMKFGLILK